MFQRSDVPAIVLRRTLVVLLWMLAVAPAVSVAQVPLGNGAAEFKEWRRLVGLPVPIEDPQMTAWAEYKAKYRAINDLQKGHQGPKPPAHLGYLEGTAETTPQWGFLACEQETDCTHFGAAIAYGPNGLRYCVLYVRGGSGRALIPRQNIPVHDTSHLSRSARKQARVCPTCGRIH